MLSYRVIEGNLIIYKGMNIYNERSEYRFVGLGAIKRGWFK